MSNQIGKLELLRRYPVKSMAGENLEGVYVSKNGIVGDRCCGLRIKGVESEHTTKRYLTGRKAVELLLCKPIFVNELEIKVSFGLEKIVDIEDPNFLKHFEQKYDISLKVDYINGLFDQKPISLIGMPSIQKLNTDPLRFRENFYIAWDKEPLYEDSLLGHILRIGNVKIRVDKQNKRCVMININPNSGENDHDVLKQVGKCNNGKLGVYCSVIQPGIVNKGDDVYLE